MFRFLIVLLAALWASVATAQQSDQKCFTQREVAAAVDLFNMANKAPGPDVAEAVVHLRRRVVELVCRDEKKVDGQPKN